MENVSQNGKRVCFHDINGGFCPESGTYITVENTYVAVENTYIKSIELSTFYFHGIIN